MESFWSQFWKFSKIKYSKNYDTVLKNPVMPGAKWFSGSELNKLLMELGTTSDIRRARLRRLISSKPIVKILEVHNALCESKDSPDLVAIARFEFLNLGWAKLKQLTTLKYKTKLVHLRSGQIFRLGGCDYCVASTRAQMDQYVRKQLRNEQLGSSRSFLRRQTTYLRGSISRF